jgi:hypothetical protein
MFEHSTVQQSKAEKGTCYRNGSSLFPSVDGASREHPRVSTVDCRARFMDHRFTHAVWEATGQVEEVVSSPMNNMGAYWSSIHKLVSDP